MGLALRTAKNGSATKIGALHLDARAFVEVSVQHGKLAIPATNALWNGVGNFTARRAEHNRFKKLIFHE